MSKLTIAVDIDDVLAVHGEAMVAYSNRVYGTKLTLDDYTENWSVFWGVDWAETERRADRYHASDDMATYKHHDASVPVLRKLAKRYRLIIVTSRRQSVSQLTRDWIEKHYGGLFEDIHFAGIWDTVSESSSKATKAELCRELGADFIIDDQSKHCNAAAAAGITAIMFGDYPWARNEELHEDVIRCKTWEEVGTFFDAQRG